MVFQFSQFHFDTYFQTLGSILLILSTIRCIGTVPQLVHYLLNMHKLYPQHCIKPTCWYMLVISACRCGGKLNRNPVPSCTAYYVTLNFRGACLNKQAFVYSNINVYVSWQWNQMIVVQVKKTLLQIHGLVNSSSRKVNEFCIFSDIADWCMLFWLQTNSFSFFSWSL